MKLIGLILLLSSLFLSQSCNQGCKGMINNVKKNAFNKKCAIEEDSGVSFTPPDGQGSDEDGDSSSAPIDPTQATFINKTTSDGLGNNSIFGVYVDGSGNIYAATPSGLSISTDGGTSFINKTTSDGLGNNYVNDVYVDGSGRIYVATGGGGLSISTDGGTSFVNKTTSDGLGSNWLRGVYVDSSGNIYAATSGGLSISN